MTKEEYHKQYRIDNADRLKEYAKEYYKQNRIKIKAYGDRYKIENSDKIKQREKRYYRKNKERYKQYAIEYAASRGLIYKFRKWKSGAKNRGIEFQITLEDLEAMPKICYYTGTELTFEWNKPNTISLDRLDNNKGYTKDNVVFCCAYINYMKIDFGFEEFLDICKHIVDYALSKQ